MDELVKQELSELSTAFLEAVAAGDKELARQYHHQITNVMDPPCGGVSLQANSTNATCKYFGLSSYARPPLTKA